MSQNIKEPKKVNWWHLLYTVAICVIICICVIISQKNPIGDTAFTNISFAATITSIVLAVVSIVYSIISGYGVSDNLGGIQAIENKIHEHLDEFKKIGDAMSDKVDDSNERLTQQVQSIGEQVSNVSTRISKWERVGSTSNTSTGYFDVNSNSVFGNIILYTASKLYEKGVNLQIDLDPALGGRLAPDYLNGYIVALCCSYPNQFVVNSDGLIMTVVKIDKTTFQGIDGYFDSESFKQRLNEDGIKDVLSVVETINNLLSKI